MLPCIIELFVVWHPQDTEGRKVAEDIFDHFMGGPSFSALIGGGVHISLRSSGWEDSAHSPRPLYAGGVTAPNGIQPAKYVAVVPLLGTEMAHAVEEADSHWHRYIEDIGNLQLAAKDQVGMFPYRLPRCSLGGTKLNDLVGRYLFIASADPGQSESCSSMLRRDLTQGIAQLVSAKGTDRLTVFISHTKHHRDSEGEEVDVLIDLIRRVIGNTRLNQFFDTSSLQPGTDWSAELQYNAEKSAMLAIRTDLYSSREWCQREMAIAKRTGVPIVMMDAVVSGEERGSFLMDHVPRIAMRKEGDCWRHFDVYRAVNLLVDECLKRSLWMRQKELASDYPELDVAWWAPHAPEPLTLSHWINGHRQNNTVDRGQGKIRILHPDPPLGPEERDVLVDYVRSTRLKRELDIMTPRQLAERGGYS